MDIQVAQPQRTDIPTTLRIERIEHRPIEQKCDLCGQRIKWCYFVRDGEQTYLIGQQCAINHLPVSVTHAWRSYFRRAEKEWKQSGEPLTAKTAYIERRVNELATPVDEEARQRKQRERTHELMATACAERLREIQRMLPDSRKYLHLDYELRNAACSVLYRHAYSFTEMEELRSERETIIQQALLDWQQNVTV